MNSKTKSKLDLSESQLRELFTKAETVRKNAYCHYSGHQVGAAIRLSNGQVFTGCNVENASFGATVCAERVAIQKAVSELGDSFTLDEILVITDATPPWPPCGMCRQVIAEFATESTKIYTVNPQEQGQVFRFDEIFPHGFTRHQMKTSEELKS